MLLALAAVCSRAAISQNANASRRIIIEHVTAIPLDGNRRIDDASIVIVGDRIESVGRSSPVTSALQALHIDGRGLYAVPGFADMHAHPYDTEGFASYLAYGVTTIGVMHGSPPVLDWRARQRAGTLDGPTIYTASPTVNGYPPANPLFIAVQDTQAARRVAAAQKRIGYDFIKAYSFLNRDVYDALLVEAHRVGIPVVGHIPFQVGYTRVLAAGQSNVAHIEEFFQSGDVPDDSMPLIAERVRRAGTTVTANLFAYIDYLRTIADIQQVLHDPEMQYASPAQLSEKLPTSNRATNRPNLQGFAEFLRTRLERFRKLLREFNKAGVPILVGTDTETFGFPGQSAQLEMFALADAGLTPYEALRAASTHAGAFVSRVVAPAERFGTLAPGQRADIVLLRGNPLDDLHNIGKVAGVLARGRWYPEARLRAMRDSVARRTAAQRQFVERFDSLIVKAKDMRTAANELRAFVGEHPSAKPFAELVWEGYGRLSIARDPVASIEIRELQAAAYPTSVAAENSLGRAYLIRGDTATALRHFVRARDLVADNFVTEDLVAKLTAARAPKRASQFDVSFDTVTVSVQGRPQRLSLRVSVEQTAATTKARVYVNSDTGVVATEVVSTDERSWVFAPAFGQTLELRWTVKGTSVVGNWTLGWANNGVLRGTHTLK
jgi:hypothetical protein